MLAPYLHACPMYLSPLSNIKRQQKMNSNQRIGHPLSGNQRVDLPVPAIFDVPSKEHCSSITGFVQCLVTRVGNNLYHFSHQVGGTETISIIGLKQSK